MRKIGPHEGKELSLLISGEKDLAMFSHAVDLEDVPFDEKKFDFHCDSGRILKEVRYYCRKDDTILFRYIFYFVPKGHWRFLVAEYLISKLYARTLPTGLWFEEVIGGLLGYPDEAIQAFLRRRQRQIRQQSQVEMQADRALKRRSPMSPPDPPPTD